MIEIKNLSKTFKTADSSLDALKNVSLTINDGDIYGIIGMSGAGKSTLVRCINMLERPTEGQILIDGVDMGSLSSKQLRDARRNITMIFQGFNLLMQRNCLKNICFPLELEGMKKEDAKKRALELLEIVGLPDKAKAYPAQLSGGQQQRIAIARALATNPKVLLCDEATSALDPNTTHSILNLIRDINKKLGITVIIITHQMSVVEETCNRVAILDNGTVVEQGEVSTVFAHPQSAAAKRLVFPDASDEIFAPASDEHRIRVVFNGAFATNTPLITKMAMDEGIAANILAASTRCIGDKVYGNMLLGIPGGDNELERASKYLQSMPDILVEEVLKMFDNAFTSEALTEALDILKNDFPLAIWETIYVTLLSTLFAIIIGLPLGVLLVAGEKGGVLPLPKALMKVLNVIINLLRSVPFLILMILVFPLTRLIVGTAVGTVASIVPLVIASFPFVARLVESSLREVNPNIIEAAQSMGASPMQIIIKVMIPESVPSLLSNFTIAITTILGYSAMSGIIGGGGLGKIAINYGYYRYKYLVMIFAVILLIALVQIFQSVGTHLATKTDKRLKK